MTARPPFPEVRPIQYLRSLTRCQNSGPEKQQSYPVLYVCQWRGVSGDQSASTWAQSGTHPRIRNTHTVKHRRCQYRDLASGINHEFNLNTLSPHRQKPRSGRADGPDDNCLSTVMWQPPPLHWAPGVLCVGSPR